MTWIACAPSPFGYAMGFSDIRVTFADGREHDCLQKMYPVGRSLVAGFAGSVKIGFMMLARLAELLHTGDDTMGWDPSVVAEWWREDARTVFQSAPDAEQQLRCELVILGVHPNQGDPWARSYVYTFRSPMFEPLAGNAPLRFSSIGKGATIRTYCEPLSALWQDDSLLQLEVGRPGGVAAGLTYRLTEKLRSLPISGISPHLHHFVVFRDRVEGGTNDRVYIRHPGPHFVMPPVAQSYPEFTKMCAASTGSIDCALA